MLPRFKSLIHPTAVLVVPVLFFLSTALSAAQNESTSFEKIDAAFQSGGIDRQEMLFEQAKAFFAPQNVSAEFKSASPGLLKSGTGLVIQIRDGWDLFTPEQQELLASYLGRPSKPYSFVSSTGYFKVHYDTSGPEAVLPGDDNGNTIPDYVERLGEYLDSSRAAYIDHLGYLSPPIDTAGGDDKYDVYLLAIQGYGYTAPDYPGDSVWDDYASYIVVDCRMDDIYTNDDPEGDVIGAQKVTAAHEFFHAVQLAYRYDGGENLWLMEATATWMEDVVYPIVNDNLNYLPDFFLYPHISLISIQAYHEYGAFIWGAFLHQRFEAAIIRKLWEVSRYNSSLQAHDSALAEYGTNLKQAFAEFTVWNYFTGGRAVPGKYYEEAAAYPQVVVDQSYPTLVHESMMPNADPGGLACNYIEFAVDSSAFGMLELELEGNDAARWAMSGVVSNPGFDTSYSVVSVINEHLFVRHPFIDDYIRVVAIPANITRYVSTSSYTLNSRVLPYGDANYDMVINVGDATYLLSYVFRGGPAPAPFLESGDANCDGFLNIADAVAIVSHVFQGGDAPCADR